MKRFFMWVFMVILLVAVIVGGALGILYLHAGVEDLPPEPLRLGETPIDPLGYEWDVPILGGVIYKHCHSATSLGAQDLGVVDQQGAALHLPSWSTAAFVRVEHEGETLYAGDAAGYAAFAWPADGEYRVEINASGGDAAARPAVPLGWYSYTVKFEMQRALTVERSAEKLPQGGVFALYVEGAPLDEAPVVECDLGPVWMAPYAAGWIGYLPAAYNAESGTYPVTVQVGERQVETQVEVIFREFEDAHIPQSAPEAPGASEEYRHDIWPLYGKSTGVKRWDSRFVQPIDGSILLDYGAYVYEGDAARPWRNNSVTIQAAPETPVVCPADGQVVFSGPLLLTGNTLVVDHGCGVKSYFYHLASLAAEMGTTVAQGQALGTAGGEPVICELKIGNKSVDPWDAWKGSSGLFYRPRFDLEP